MKNFLKNIIAFLILASIIGEVVVRLTHASADIPTRIIDKYGIQKYHPNQKGYWKNGTHTWMINASGWPGYLPKSYENLINIIGDSYIENFMNPNDCRQSVLLKEHLPNNNFLEASRSGVSLIESFEISKQTDTLKPKKTLIYANTTDFYQSIQEINKYTDITQINLDKGEIDYGDIKLGSVKKILYSWKLVYYFYNRFFPSLNVKKNGKSVKKSKSEDEILKLDKKIKALLNYIKNNYDTKDKILVMHPNINSNIIENCKEFGFNIIILDSSNDKSWTFDYDIHWNCYGNKMVAKQVANTLKNIVK